MKLDRLSLFKKLLPGFIPLFVFIAADAIWGTEVGLIVALAVGVFELVFTYIKEKRFDKFILLDTALLMVLGSVSLLLHNDVFFKLKPALIEGIMCVILAMSAFTKVDVVGAMSQRYMKGIEMNDRVKKQFKRSIQSMFYIFTAHTLLVLYSAFYLSKEAWAFVSGGLFYVIFGVYFLYEFVHQKRKGKKAQLPENDEEWLPVVDDDGKVIGKAPRSACHRGEKILHPVVHLHVLNTRKHLFLQKRPEDKEVQPGKWDTSVGGHIAFGEDLQTAMKREAYEEIGLKTFSVRMLASYKWDTDVELELVYSFVSYDYKQINLHSDEVKEGRFWSPKQIEQNLGKGVFTPNFEYEYQHFLKPKLF